MRHRELKRTFMVSAAFAGPLAKLVGAEGGGVHMVTTNSIHRTAFGSQNHATSSLIIALFRVNAFR
jgi:hypothetical protein